MNTKGRSAVGAVFAAAAVLAAAGLAWACTPQQYISTVRPSSGAAGAQVLVSGQASGPGMVAILWDGPSGQKIGEALVGQDGRFSIVAQIPPAASPNVYSIIASSGPAGVARTAFEVTAEAPGSAGQAVPSAASRGPIDGAAADLWRGFSGDSTGLNQVDLASGNGQTPANPMIATGLGLVGVGVAASGGALVVASRRKRGTASGTR